MCSHNVRKVAVRVLRGCRKVDVRLLQGCSQDVVGFRGWLHQFFLVPPRCPLTGEKSSIVYLNKVSLLRVSPLSISVTVVRLGATVIVRHCRALRQGRGLRGLPCARGSGAIRETLNSTQTLVQLVQLGGQGDAQLLVEGHGLEEVLQLLERGSDHRGKREKEIKIAQVKSMGKTITSHRNLHGETDMASRPQRAPQSRELPGQTSRMRLAGPQYMLFLTRTRSLGQSLSHSCPEHKPLLVTYKPPAVVEGSYWNI